MKTYAEAVQFLYDLRLFGAKLGLENTRKLADLAAHPHDRLRFIHVAGTNGKGSVCAMLESIYRRAGLRVGLYTSPHLISFCERIQVNREMIPEVEVVRLVERFQELLRKLVPAQPTFFEVTTVMAMQYFAEQNCDLVIWETGLGGRLDATNIVTPIASVITNVQRDHEKWLGNSVREIAREKAGIIKAGVPVITGCDNPEALEVISDQAKKLNCPLTIARAASSIPTSLKGGHQRKNAAVAVETVNSLQSSVPVSGTDIREGLSSVEWAGRLQLVRGADGNETLIDGAHNPDGFRALADYLRAEHPGRRFVFIIGVLAEKRWEEMFAKIAPLAERVLLVPVASERSSDPAQLKSVCGLVSPETSVAVCDDLEAVLRETAGGPIRVVTGSLHFIGEALEKLTQEPRAHAQERALNDWSSPKV